MHITSWVYNDKSGTVVITRANGDVEELPNVEYIKKLIPEDIDDLNIIGLINLGHALAGIVAGSILKKIVANRDKRMDDVEKAQNKDPKGISIGSRRANDPMINMDLSLPPGEPKPVGTAISKPRGM